MIDTKKEYIKNVVLLLTHSKDDCASMVGNKLKDIKVPFVRLDTDTFHKDIKIVMNLNSSGDFSGEYVFSRF